MGRPRKIPSELDDEILRRSHTERPSQIRQWLEDEHGVSVTTESVYNILKAIRSRQVVETTLAVETTGAPEAPGNLGKLQGLIDQVVSAAKVTREPYAMARLAATAGNLISKHMRLSGVGVTIEDLTEDDERVDEFFQAVFGTKRLPHKAEA